MGRVTFSWMFRQLIIGFAALAGLAAAQALPKPKGPDRVVPLRVTVGQVAPDFTLPAVGGATVRLSSLRGHRLLVDFYRGYW